MAVSLHSLPIFVRLAGRPVHEVVPSVEVPLVHGAAIRVDGVLDEPAWEQAARLSLVRDNVTGRDLVASGEAPATGVRLLWDDEHLYMAFEVSDDDVWARSCARDDPGLTADEAVRVLLDDGGDEVTYHELAVSPANVVYDAFGYMPGSPHDFSPGAPFVGLPAWDARGLLTATRVEGTLDLVERWGPVQETDVDRGYVVELALPWESLRSTTIPGLGSIQRDVAPRPGDCWRLGLHRVEWRRPVVDGTEAPEVQRRDPARHRLHKAWSPTHLGQPHLPARFGVIAFAGTRPSGPR